MPPLKPVTQKAKNIQMKIYNLLYSPSKSQTKAEQLTITIIRNKAHTLKFLKAYSKWSSVGIWKQYKDNNYIIQIQFWDTKNNSAGRRLKRLLKQYNRAYINEDVLYFYTTRLSESLNKKDLL